MSWINKARLRLVVLCGLLCAAVSPLLCKEGAGAVDLEVTIDPTYPPLTKGRDERSSEFRTLEDAASALQRGAYPRATAAFAQLAQQSSPAVQVQAQLEQVRALRTHGRYADAMALADTAVRRLWHSDRTSAALPVAQALLASVARLAGDYRAALQAAAAAQAAWAAQSPCATPDTAELLLTRAWLLHTYGKTSAAWQQLTTLESCREVLDAHPLLDAQRWLLRAALAHAAHGRTAAWFTHGVPRDASPDAAWDAADARLHCSTDAAPHPYCMALALERAQAAAASADHAAQQHWWNDAARSVHHHPWLAQHPWNIRWRVQRIAAATLHASVAPCVELLRDAADILGAQHPGMVVVHAACVPVAQSCADNKALPARARQQCTAQHARWQHRAEHLQKIIAHNNPWQ